MITSAKSPISICNLLGGPDNIFYLTTIDLSPI